MTADKLPQSLVKPPQRRQRCRSAAAPAVRQTFDRSANMKLWATAVEELYQCGFLVGEDGKPPRQIGDMAYACTPGNVGWSAVARELAAILPGHLKPSAAHHCQSITWQNGNANHSGVLLEPKLAATVLDAQKTVRLILPKSPDRWTLGGLCRVLFTYVGARDFCAWPKKGATNIGADRLLDGVTFGYMHVCPGLYEKAYYHDVSSYYYTMLTRLPTLRPDVVRGGVIFSDPDPAEWERWQRVLIGVKDHKHLRNTLAGVAMGSFKGMVYYSRDSSGAVIKRVSYAHGGPFRTAGLLLVRSGYEITLKQCNKNDTVYARIDSAITLDSRQAVWEGYGFNVKAEHEGNTEICQLGSYRVREHETKPYTNGQREYVPKLGAMKPHTIEYSKWLL